MPAPNTFTTTANSATFLDMAGDRLAMRIDVIGGGPVLKIATAGQVPVYVPPESIDELIENLQHLKRRAEQLAPQRTIGK